MEIEDIRRTVSATLDPSRRSELGQFFTPAAIAGYMAGMFSPAHRPVRLLDAGAGVGCLLHAAAKAMPVGHIEAWEVDASLIPPLARTLANLVVPHKIHHGDFILEAPALCAIGRKYDRAILNPPYRKIANGSSHRLTMEALGVKATNLYTAFIAAAILLMDDGGEIVAIVPRSFLNGLYHRPFRQHLLAMSSLDRIHVFHSRRSVFGEDSILQENVIVKMTRGHAQGDVVISSSSDNSFSDITTELFPFDRVVLPGDDNRFIRIPSTSIAEDTGVSLAELGIEVSTGPAVEFRVRGSSVDEEHPGVQLITSKHFTPRGFSHPVPTAKVNRLARDGVVQKCAWPIGDYVVVKRISAKESKRRILAYHLRAEELEGPDVVFENHLNVYHSSKGGLSRDFASHLRNYLNSDVADQEFRSISGSTQVNATDLRSMRYPSSLSGL